MWHTILLVTHVFIAAAMIGLILLQRGKGADAGAAFGAGASGTVFGARGSATFLSKSTAVLATAFFVSSLWLAYLGGQRSEPTSLLDEGATAIEQPAETPALPEPIEAPAMEEQPAAEEPAEQPPSEGS